MTTKLTDIDIRLNHIQAAVLNLFQDMDPMEFHKVKGYIEALCRHRDLSVDAENVPPIILGTLTQL